MIKFVDLQGLKTVIDRLSIPKPKEAHSAYGCILIKQVDSRVTSFTTCEPTRGTYTEYFHHTDTESFGQDEVVYMVNYTEFSKLIQKLESTAQKSITILEQKGQLIIYTDAYSIDGETIEYRYCNTLRLYTEHERFKVLSKLKEEELIAYAPAKEFVNFVKTLYRFGQYDEKAARVDASLTRTTILNFSQDNLMCLASNKNARNLQIRLETSVTQVDNTQEYLYVIEGRQLPKLFGLSDGTISIYANSNYIMFSNSKSEVILALNDLPTEFLNTNSSLIQNNSFTQVSERFCNIYSLYSAIVNQQNNDNKADTELLIRDEETELIVSALSRLMNIDEARVQLDLSMDNNGDWELFIYNYIAIEKALDTLKNYLSFKNKDEVSHLVHLVQEVKAHQIENESVKLWYFKMLLVQDSKIQILYRAKGPEYVIAKIQETEEI